MEEYRYENEEECKETYQKRKARAFPDSALNAAIPLWMKWIFFLLGWVGFQLLSIVVQMVCLPLYVKLGKGMFNALMMLLVYGLLVLFFAIFFIVDEKMRKALIDDFKDFRAILFGIGIFALILVLENFISRIYTLAFPTIYGSNANQQGLQSDVMASPVMLFFPIVLFAPFTEEMTYRLGLLDATGEKKRWVGILVSAIIFGLIHFSFDSVFQFVRYDQLVKEGASSLIKVNGANPVFYTKLEVRNMMINEFLNLPVYMLAGALMGLGYCRTGKISTSITAHVCNNLLSFLAMVIVSSNPSNATSVVLRFIR